MIAADHPPAPAAVPVVGEGPAELRGGAPEVRRRRSTAHRRAWRRVPPAAGRRLTGAAGAGRRPWRPGRRRRPAVDVPPRTTSCASGGGAGPGAARGRVRRPDRLGRLVRRAVARRFAAVSPASADRPARPAAARRARAWYSGPCLRGSAYSFGLSVQYVPLVVPYQLAPPQSARTARPRRRRTRSTRASPCSGGLAPRGRRRPEASPVADAGGPRRVRGRPTPGRAVGLAPGTRRAPARPRRARAARAASAGPARPVPDVPRRSAPDPGGPVAPSVAPAATSRRRHRRGDPGRPPGAATAVGSPRRVARSGSASQGRRGVAGGRRPSRCGRAADELLVRGLDREEPRQRRLAGRVGVVGLGQPPVGALDLVERSRHGASPSVRYGSASRVMAGRPRGAAVRRRRVVSR